MSVKMLDYIVEKYNVDIPPDLLERVKVGIRTRLFLRTLTSSKRILL